MRFTGLCLGFSLLVIIHLASCSKETHSTGNTGNPDSLAGTFPADSPLARLNPEMSASLTDISYGADPRQKMDVTLMAKRNMATPFVVLFHGGAWSQGDKKDLQSEVTFFLSQGINVANVNYRLTNSSSGSVRWNGILSDVAGAIAWLNKHSDSLQSRPGNYVAFGFSAGAHLALLHAYAYDSNRLVSAVIGFGSPTKFNDAAWKVNPFLNIARQALPPLTGQSFSADTASSVLVKLSPYFSPHYKPTLLIHGDKDNVVPWSQSSLMYARLQATGTASSFITLAHSGHSGEGASQADYNHALQACADWVKKYSR